MTIYLFDASSIIACIELIGENAINMLKNQYTINLSYYEIGNFLWKQYLKSRCTLEKLKFYLNLFKNLLNKMYVLNIELMNEVLELAAKLKLTYYDAAYVYAAWKLNAMLITEDLELYEKAKSIVKVHRIDEIAK